MTSVSGVPSDPCARLVWLRRQFLNGFAHQWEIKPGSMAYAGTGMWPIEKPDAEQIRTYEHQIICGDGASANEAIDDWYSRLPKGGGYAIIWRVEPELASELDFDSKVTRWRVFSRFCVIPTEPAVAA